MKILLLTQFFDPEPGCITGLNFATWLVKRGHEVHVLTGFPNYPDGRFYKGYPIRLFRKESIYGVKVTRVILYPSHSRSPFRRAANYLSFALCASSLGLWLTPHCDVTYVYHPPATIGLPAILFKKLRSQPIVYHVQDMWPESVIEAGMINSKGLLKQVERVISVWCNLVYKEASAIAVIAPGMKDLLIERGVPSSKIEVIPNWTDEDAFHPVTYDEMFAKTQGFEGYFNVVYSGNLGLYQGLETAVLAAHRVRHLIGFRLVFIGSGQMESQLRSLTAELELDNVIFLGRLPFRDVGAINNLADALLVSLRDLPFFRSTIPGKTQMALACGRPLIISVAGDAAEMVSRARAGLICAPDNVEELAEAFERTYSMPADELSAMGARGRSYYEDELAMEKGASRLEAVMLAQVVEIE